MTTPAETASAPPTTRARLGGATRVWILVAVLSVAGGALFASTFRGFETPAPVPGHLPWWAIAIAFCVTEAFVVHVHFRREAHTLSFSELPLVAGLFLATPGGLLVGELVVAGVALAGYRRQPRLKVAFNLAQFGFSTTLALIVFHAFPGAHDPRSASAWVAALAAAFTSSATGVVLVSCAIWLAEGRSTLSELPRVAGMALVGVVANVSLALAAILLAAHHAALLLMVAPIAACVVAFRAYTAQRTRREHLEFLYESMRTVQAAPDLEAAAAELLRAARRMLRADYAELLLVPHSAEEGVLRAVDSQRLDSTVQRVELEGLDRDALGVVLEGEGPVLLPERRRPHALDDFLRHRGLRDAIVTAVIGEERPLGILLVGDRSGDVSTFSVPDLRLFERFAHHAEILLENDRLEQALARLTELQERLRHQAYHDAVTQLPNRRYFIEQVGEALERPSARAAVLFIDLDDFKAINDSLGHAAGDQLLHLVAARIAAAIRPGDVPARLGGDEFAVLLPRAQPAVAKQVAERITTSLREPFVLGGRQVAVRASIGIGTAGDGVASADELLRNADVAMYSAKANGKHRSALYDPELHAAAMNRHELMLALEHAAERGEITAFFQPIVRLGDGSPIGFEALVRWQRPGTGMMLPGSFITLAEEAGLLGGIRRQVLTDACKALGRWRAQHTGLDDVFVAVNLAASDLAAPELVDEVTTILTAAGIGPSALVLEVTESGAMTPTGAVSTTLARLRELGVRFALDDFGTGYSSLAHIGDLPIDIIKVPKTFTDGLGGKGPAQAITSTIVTLAGSLGLECVVEGIETDGQAEALRALGCELGQGFLFATPADAASVSAWLAGVTPNASRRPAGVLAT